jgi:hypothetical protein
MNTAKKTSFSPNQVKTMAAALSLPAFGAVSPPLAGLSTCMSACLSVCVSLFLTPLYFLYFHFGTAQNDSFFFKAARLKKTGFTGLERLN